MTITDILRDNIASILGHTPCVDELRKFIDSFHDFISDKREEKTRNPQVKIFLSEIESRLYDVRDSEFRLCDECGEYVLPSEYNDCKHQCLRCAPHFDPDFERDLWRE